MRRAILSASALTLLLFAGPAFAEKKNIADTDPRTPADEAKRLHLPPGFEIQLVASEPDIHKPLNMDFDDRGRLWVTETDRVSLPGEGRQAQGPGRRQDPRRLRPRRQGTQDHDLRRRPQHPHRRAAAAVHASRRTPLVYSIPNI